MIKRHEVNTYTEHLYCNRCFKEDGSEVEMNFMGTQLLSSPPQYPHICPKCGTVERVRGVMYPRTVTSPVSLPVGLKQRFEE